jgi:replicative DNA helicase
MEKIEFLILRNLLYNDEYTRKVLPFIKSDYFQDYSQKIVFEQISSFISEYNKLATQEVLAIELENRTDLNETTFKEISQVISNLDDVYVEFDWLINTTEKWCRDRAIYLALMESIHIADGNDENKSRDSIPSILQDALAVSFDSHIGHDYLSDYEERFEFYNRKDIKLPFGLEYMDKITNGGISPKTLSLVIAFSGVGKSAWKCHYAASLLTQGKNVLYITLEMAEEEIARRIDANLMDVNIKDIENLSKTTFINKVNSISSKTQGALVIKEYPTSSAHVGHFRALLNDLALKKSFVPDIIFIDYLNICASSRQKVNTSPNSYSYVKSIAEEVRGLAVEYNVPVFSGVQFNREGGYNTDPDLTNTSDSVGIVYTADFIFAMISTEELEAANQIIFKQLKNRYGDVNKFRKFVVGIDRPKMRFYDVEQKAQEDLIDNKVDGQERKSLTSKFGGIKFND